MKKITTNTKTIGKQAQSIYNEMFKDCKKRTRHGRNSLDRLVRFYNESNELIGYWTNQGVDKGYFVRLK